MRFLVFSIFLAILYPGSLLLNAQEAPCTRQTVTVSLVDSKGSHVTNCDASCFRATFRKKPVRIQFFSGPLSPLRAVILLDASGSMNMQGKWDLALFTARDIIRATPPQSTFALVVFGTGVLTKVEFDQGNGIILRELDASKTSRDKIAAGYGRTALFDGILQAVQLLGQRRSGDAIFVISDGGDNSSHSSPSAVEATLLESGIRLFTALLDREYLPLPRELPDSLLDLTSRSGGYSLRLAGSSPSGPGLFYEPSPKFLQSTDAELQKIFHQMTTYYRMEIETSEEPKKFENWKLELDPSVKERLKGAQISYPQKIGPCGRGIPLKEKK